jgi:hypothetical protein
VSERNRPEANVERGQICPFYGGLGVEVYPTSVRVHPIGVRPGVADLICFFPRLGFHFFHETKVPPRRQTREQREFEQACVDTNVPYVLGGIDEAMDFIVHLGLGVRVGPTVRVKPRNEWPEHYPDQIEYVGELAVQRRSWPMSAATRDAHQKFGYRAAA